MRAINRPRSGSRSRSRVKVSVSRLKAFSSFSEAFTSISSSWKTLRGSWSASSGTGSTSTLASNYPLAVVKMSKSNVTASAKNTSPGIGIAIWVTDSGNWWGVATGQDSGSSCNCQSCSTCNSYTCNSYTCNSSQCNSLAFVCTGGNNICSGGYNTCSGGYNTCAGYTFTCLSTRYTCTGYSCWSYYSKPGNCKTYNYYGNICNAYYYSTTCDGYYCSSGYSSCDYGYDSCTGGYNCSGWSCSGWSCAGGYSYCAQSTCLSESCVSASCSSTSYYNCNCQTCYPPFIRVLKSASNIVTEMYKWTISTIAASIKVITSGQQITVRAYSDNSLTTQIGSDLTYTATGATIDTSFGIVVTPSAYAQGSSLDGFQITTN